MAKHNVPEKVGEVLKEIGETRETAGWDCHGTFVLLHKALEKVAAHKGVTFEPPQIVESDVANKNAVMIVTGHLGEKTEWSIGEAAPYNNKNSYPYAMAEKRAKDRVILKLVGLHGDVYSEEEADAFKEARPQNMAANSGAAPAGGSAKLDAAFAPVPDLQATTEAGMVDAVQSILDTFPGSKVASIKPTKAGFSSWATACKEAFEAATEAPQLHQVIGELQKAFAQYNDGNGITKMMNKLYSGHYVPACKALNIEPEMLTPRDNEIAI